MNDFLRDIARRAGFLVIGQRVESPYVSGADLSFVLANFQFLLSGSLKTFSIGDTVRKKSGSAWSGKIVGTYSTSLTPEGYAVESDAHPGSVQIYPAAALELVK